MTGGARRKGVYELHFYEETKKTQTEVNYLPTWNEYTHLTMAMSSHWSNPFLLSNRGRQIKE